MSGEKADAINAGRDATPDHVILDPSGDIGRLYDAKTTPHMFVIKGDQQIAYAGAIDSIRSAKVEDIEDADNYVRSALDAVDTAVDDWASLLPPTLPWLFPP